MAKYVPFLKDSLRVSGVWVLFPVSRCFLVCLFLTPCPHVSQCAQSELDAETVKSILAEYKIHNADITLRSDVTADDLIDVVEGNRYVMTARDSG